MAICTARAIGLCSSVSEVRERVKAVRRQRLRASVIVFTKPASRCDTYMQVSRRSRLRPHPIPSLMAPQSAARTAPMRSRSDNDWPCGTISISHCRLLCCGLSKNVRRVPSQSVICASLSKEQNLTEGGLTSCRRRPVPARDAATRLCMRDSCLPVTTDSYGCASAMLLWCIL